MVQDLCKHFSPPLLSLESPVSDSDDVVSYHPLPSPSALAAPEVATKLRSLGFGYRADYIKRTAKMLVENHGTAMTNSKAHCVVEAPERWLMTLRDLDTLNARDSRATQVCWCWSQSCRLCFAHESGHCRYLHASIIGIDVDLYFIREKLFRWTSTSIRSQRNIMGSVTLGVRRKFL